MKWPVVFRGLTTAWQGMGLTMRHLLRAGRRRKVQDIRNEKYFNESQGLSTLLYPYESIPIPENGRYLLHNEIEDCIVCDKCAKICPVNCIEIEPIRSASEIGKTSDGTSKRIYAARFDIDMAKCCFCGLCTTVCPTECLIMTPEYDVPVLDLSKLNFGFGNMTEAEAEQRRKEWEEEKARKESTKQAASPDNSAEKAGNPVSGGMSGSNPAIRSGPRPSPFPRPPKTGDESK